MFFRPSQSWRPTAWRWVRVVAYLSDELLIFQSISASPWTCLGCCCRCCPRAAAPCRQRFESACRGSVLMLLRPRDSASRARDSVTWLAGQLVEEEEEGMEQLDWLRGCADGVAVVELRHWTSFATADGRVGRRCRWCWAWRRYRWLLALQSCSRGDRRQSPR